MLIKRDNEILISADQEENIKKLLTLANCIDDIKVQDESLFIKFKKDFIMYTQGHHINYCDGQTAIKCQYLHINPETEIKQNVEEINSKKAISCINKDINKKLRTFIDETIKNDPDSCSC